MEAADNTFRIERATERDAAVILKLIQGLADYERLSGDVSATEEHLRLTLFGKSSRVGALLAYAAEDAIGFAVFFENFSTFLGRPGMYLEDLFVLPEWRKQGIGRSLMRAVAQIAVERGCGRMEWSVLDWNTPAIAFYERIGARAMDQWTVYRLNETELRNFSGKTRGACS